MRDLIPQELLGRCYIRRLGTMTATIVIVGLAGSFFVSRWQGFAPVDQAIYAYSLLLIALQYGPGDNQGPDTVHLTVIGADGQLQPATGITSSP